MAGFGLSYCLANRTTRPIARANGNFSTGGGLPTLIPCRKTPINPNKQGLIQIADAFYINYRRIIARFYLVGFDCLRLGRVLADI